MQNFPLSDLSMSLTLQRQSRDIRAAMDEAGFEMTTGLRSDLIVATEGAVDKVFAIDRSLTLLEQQGTGLLFAGNRAGVVQVGLENIQTSAGEIGLQLSAAVSRGDLLSADQYAKSAMQVLDAAVGVLNSTFGGRYIFSGAAEGERPMASAITLVSDIGALINAAPDAATAIADVEQYFNAAGGTFETTIYQGATEDAPGVLTPDGDKIDYMVRADAQPIRDILRGLAMAASFDGTTLASSTDDKTDVYLSAGATMQEAKEEIVNLRALLGVTEQNIAETQSFVAGQTAALQFARNDIVGVDQYDAATRFAALESQLNAAYTVTARISNLSLTNFLR